MRLSFRQPGRGSLLVLSLLAVGAAALADVLFFEAPVGWTLGLFGAALATAVLVRPGQALATRAGRVLATLVAGLVVDIEYLHGLGSDALPALRWVGPRLPPERSALVHTSLSHHDELLRWRLRDPRAWTLRDAGLLSPRPPAALASVTRSGATGPATPRSTPR